MSNIKQYNALIKTINMRNTAPVIRQFHIFIIQTEMQISEHDVCKVHLTPHLILWLIFAFSITSGV